MVARNKRILSEARVHVSNLISGQLSSSFVFHNLKHTKDVVNAVKILSRYYKLRKDDYFALLMAAWFHDTGITEGKFLNHELASITIADRFLKGKIPTSTILKVNSCILATRLPQTPTNLIEKIRCDADLFHLGTSYFSQRTELLRRETEFLSHKELPKDVWMNINIDFLSKHKYFTRYGRTELESKKGKWLREASRH